MTRRLRCSNTVCSRKCYCTPWTFPSVNLSFTGHQRDEGFAGNKASSTQPEAGDFARLNAAGDRADVDIQDGRDLCSGERGGV